MNQRTMQAVPCAVEHDEPDRQGEAHQEISNNQVDGVNNRGGFCLGTEAEYIQCQAVQDDTHQENDGIDHHQGNRQAVKFSVQVFVRVDEHGEQVDAGVGLLGGIDMVKSWQLGGGGRHGHCLLSKLEQKKQRVIDGYTTA